jgi:predicted Rossmann fold nucleotide-binding protein DprA/Smf involved in DNA uptake
LGHASARHIHWRGFLDFGVHDSCLVPNSLLRLPLIPHGHILGVKQTLSTLVQLHAELGCKLNDNRKHAEGIADEKSEPPQADDQLRTKIVELLGPAPVSIDDLVREAGAPPGAQIALLELELAGKLKRKSGLVSRA